MDRVLLQSYIPMDRRQALASGEPLPEEMVGTALFADISGFTSVTETLVQTLGPRRGAEELTRVLNLVYDALIAKVDTYGGSVVSFSGDAITCWFNQDEGRRATAAALAMQEAMERFAVTPTAAGQPLALAMKVGIARGPVRRFLLGDPAIQYLDSLAGSTVERMALAATLARRGEVLVDLSVATALTGKSTLAGWRVDEPSGTRFAIVTALSEKVAARPWPPLSLNALSEAQLRPWLLPAIYERLQDGQEAYLAEIRPAVALFLRFDGLDYDADPAAGLKLDVYTRWVQNTLARYGGVLLDLSLGDKGNYLYAVFGALIAHDDDVIRAVTAALALGGPPPVIDFISEIRIGLSMGQMRVGAYGGMTRRTYGTLGDEVNVAARLMEFAPPHAVLVSQRVADVIAAQYALQPIGLTSVKGKQEPLPLFQVLGRKSPSLHQVMTPFSQSFVGREAELSQLTALLEGSRAGRGQVVRLEGAAGVGKSHLAAILVGQAARHTMRIVMGSCQSSTQHSAYSVWRQVTRTLLGVDERIEPDQLEAWIAEHHPSWLLRLPLLGDLLGLSIPDNPTTAVFAPGMRQEALAALVVDIVCHTVQGGPLLLLFDDMQWMDEASQSLTLALARAIGDMGQAQGAGGVFLLLVHQSSAREGSLLLPELEGLPHYSRLEVPALSPEEVHTLVVNCLGGEPSQLALSLIQARAQGNPFFVEALVNTLREAGDLFEHEPGRWWISRQIFDTLRAGNCLVRVNGEWTLDARASLSAIALHLPDSIQRIVLSRLDRLPEGHRLTLKAASVIGRIFPLELLCQVHPMHPGWDTLLRVQLALLEVGSFVHLERTTPELCYSFMHNVTQEVAYETLLESQRRTLHQVVGAVLEQHRREGAGELIEQLAYHFCRSGLRHKALLYLEMAAEKSQRDYANETALNYYTEALALEERWPWRERQVELLHLLGRREKEAAALRLLEANEAAPRFRVAYLWGQYYEALGDYPKAQQQIEQARALCRANADELNEARCLAYLGLIAHRQGEYESAKQCYTEAIARFGEGATSDEEERTLAQLLSGLGTIHRQQGYYDQALLRYRRALSLSRKSGDRQSEAQILNDLGGIAFYQRDFEVAQRYYAQALELRRAIGERAGEGSSLYNLATTALEIGDYAEAETFFTAALSIQRSIGNRWEEAAVWRGMALLYRLLGALDKAQHCAEQGLALSQAIGDEAGWAAIQGHLGLIALERGAYQQAEALLNKALALVRMQDDKYQTAYLSSHLAIASLLGGNFSQAITYATHALTLRQELDLFLWTTITADLSTLAATYLAVGDEAQAHAYALRALAILDTCDETEPEFPHRDYFVCYQVLSALGDLEEGRAALDSAYRLVQRRAARISDPALRRSFLEQGPINRRIAVSYQRSAISNDKNDVADR